jgi:tetratricopeptide (TPR) repeat protein
MGDRPFLPTFAMRPESQQAVRALLDQHFGPGQARLVQMATSRSDPSDEYHLTQLREKPDDPNTHSNYGAYLKDIKRDLAGAESEYRKAIALDPNHANALGNLANLLWEKRNTDQAGILYRRALAASPGHENVRWNYARFLLNEFTDLKTAHEVLDRGITANDQNGRLLVLRAEVRIREGNAAEALEDYRLAREKGANAADVEVGYSFALQLCDAPIDDCIVAYRVAIGLNPNNADLQLNLAQLLFVKGEDIEANRFLREVLRLGLSDAARLEANFYLLAHTQAAPTEVLRAIKSVLDRGARLRWNVRPNIEAVRRREPQKAALLELLAAVMKGERDQSCLEQVLAQWPSNQAR